MTRIEHRYGFDRDRTEALAPEVLDRLHSLASPDQRLRKLTQEKLLEEDLDALPFLSEAMKSEIDAVRWEALKVLLQINRHECLPILIFALRDRVGSIAWTAANGILSFESAGLNYLLDALAKFPSLAKEARTLLYIFEQYPEPIRRLLGPLRGAVQDGRMEEIADIARTVQQQVPD